MEAKIEVFARDVSNTKGLFHHLFIVHTDTKGVKTVLEGGPGRGGMLFGNMKITKENKGNDFQIKSPGIVIATGTDTQINNLIDKMWHKAEEINNGKYDYKLPGVGHIQNSNSAVSEMIKAADLTLNFPKEIGGKCVNIPGVNSQFKDTVFDYGMDIVKESMRLLGEGLGRVSDEGDA